MRRIDKEKRIVGKMVKIYCRAHHNPDTDLCPECSEILDYSSLKLDLCPFGEGKPPCKNCETHCFEPAKREHIRKIMRYSGPRMFFADILSWLEHKIKAG